MSAHECLMPDMLSPRCCALSLLQAEVWRCFEAASLFGVEVATLGGPRGPSTSHFLPYLSAVHMFRAVGEQEVAAAAVPQAGPAGQDSGAAQQEQQQQEQQHPLMQYPGGLESWPAAMRPAVQWAECGHMGGRVPLLTKLLELCGSEGEAHPILSTRLADLHPYSW